MACCLCTRPALLHKPHLSFGWHYTVLSNSVNWTWHDLRTKLHCLQSCDNYDFVNYLVNIYKIGIWKVVESRSEVHALYTKRTIIIVKLNQPVLHHIILWSSRRQRPNSISTLILILRTPWSLYSNPTRIWYNFTHYLSRKREKGGIRKSRNNFCHNSS